MLPVFILVLFITGCTSCGDIDESDIYFPVDKEIRSSYPEALVEGTLVLENSYLRIDRFVDGSVLPVWPHGYSLHIEGGEIQVLDNEGRLVASVGDSIKAGGGEIAAQIVEEFIGESLPHDCEGPYWLFSEVIDD